MTNLRQLLKITSLRSSNDLGSEKARFFSKTPSRRVPNPLFLIGLLIAVAVPFPLPNLPYAFVSAESIKEYQVEAAFIYQFTNYIEWPKNRGPSSDGPFVITLVGNSPLYQELEGVAKSKTIKSRPIEIRKGSGDIGQLQSSHIIVVTSEDEGSLKDVLAKARKTSSLVISAAEGFAEKGAMINFFKDGERLRFEINRTALEEKKLQASSQLLKLARIIE